MAVQLLAGGVRIAVATAIIAVLSGTPVVAQSIEPRAYSPAPAGTNFIVLAASQGHGPLEADPALPVSDIDLRVRGATIGYVRSLNLWGKSAKFDVIVPYTQMAGHATFLGTSVERRIAGFGDPAVRATILLHGAPALTPAQFQTYRQDLLIGLSVQGTLPIGEYDRSQLLNLSTNRWSIKPEVGGSKTWGRWTLELAGGATVYGVNREFLGTHVRKQKPVYAVQSHLIYNVAAGAWVAANLSYFTGGENLVDRVNRGGLRDHWRVGLIATIPATRQFSVKFSGSKGISARTGARFDLMSVALQYRWGRGA